MSRHVTCCSCSWLGQTFALKKFIACHFNTSHLVWTWDCECSKCFAWSFFRSDVDRCFIHLFEKNTIQWLPIFSQLEKLLTFAYVFAYVCTWCASMCGLRKAHQHAAGGVLCIRDWGGIRETLLSPTPGERAESTHWHQHPGARLELRITYTRAHTHTY